MGFLTRAGKTAVLGTVTAAVTALLTAAPAQAAKHCDFSISTNRYSCSGSGSVRNPSDVIGGKLFTGLDYTGDSLTIWVPRPCPKNDQVDYWVDLGTDMRNKVSSVQAWSSCWVWLYFADGQRDGPYKGNEPDVGTWANDRAVTVGLS
ncbi:hypothetical protein ACWEIJ_20835 [Lentzea sp. NPDC004789]